VAAARPAAPAAAIAAAARPAGVSAAEGGCPGADAVTSTRAATSPWGNTHAAARASVAARATTGATGRISSVGVDAAATEAAEATRWAAAASAADVEDGARPSTWDDEDSSTPPGIKPTISGQAGAQKQQQSGGPHWWRRGGGDAVGRGNCSVAADQNARARKRRGARARDPRVRPAAPLGRMESRRGSRRLQVVSRPRAHGDPPASVV